MKTASVAIAVLFVAYLAVLFAACGGDGGNAPAAGRIAFVSERDGNREIYVMNADGSGLARLTDNPADDFTPDGPLDGAHIAFTSSRDGNWEIYVMNADGSGQTRLTNNPAADGVPAWAP